MFLLYLKIRGLFSALLLTRSGRQPYSPLQPANLFFPRIVLPIPPPRPLLPPTEHAKKAKIGENNQERIFSPKRKFLGRTSRGHPGVIRADIPTQNFGQGAQDLGKTSIWARISMTRRRGRPRPQGIPQNFGQKNFGLIFRSLNRG